MERYKTLHAEVNDRAAKVKVVERGKEDGGLGLTIMGVFPRFTSSMATYKGQSVYLGGLGMAMCSNHIIAYPCEDAPADDDLAWKYRGRMPRVELFMRKIQDMAAEWSEARSGGNIMLELCERSGRVYYVLLEFKNKRVYATVAERKLDGPSPTYEFLEPKARLIKKRIPDPRVPQYLAKIKRIAKKKMEELKEGRLILEPLGTDNLVVNLKNKDKEILASVGRKYRYGPRNSYEHFEFGHYNGVCVGRVDEVPAKAKKK